MKLENQLTSLEPSKRLKELGVKQNSAFYWINDRKNATEEISTLRNIKIPAFAHNHLFHYSAFSVAELGEMLPENIFKKNKLSNKQSCLFLQINKQLYSTGMNYVCTYCNSDNLPIYHASSEKLADAMAEMIIYLLENKLIKIGELKWLK